MFVLADEPRASVPFLIKKISFAGIVVAKLPFVPFSLLQNISHRKLEGEDPTDCSVVRAKTVEQYNRR